MGDYLKLVPKKKSVAMMFKRQKTPMLIFRHGHIAITQYRPGDNMEFERALSVFNEMNFTSDMKVGVYVPELKEFRIPRGFDIHLLAKYFSHYHVLIDNQAYPADKIDSQLLSPPRDDFQRVGLSFLCSQGEFKKNSIYTTLMITSSPGSGKTYLGAATSIFMQARAVIICPIKRVMEEWRKAYTTFTTIKDSEILFVEGSDTCKKIAKGKYAHIKVFVFSTDTIISYDAKYGHMATIDLLSSTNAYLKIVDEVHKDLKAVSIIEGLSNFHMNFYMSATPKRTNKKEKWIFYTIYRNVPKFGKNFKTQDEKHINVVVKTYRFIPTTQQQKRMITLRTGWLNSNSYERELINAPLEQKQDLIISIFAMLNWSKKLLKKDNKILFLVKTIEGTAFVQELCEKIFPGETSRYYGSLSQSEKTKALKARVICATDASMGTGVDLSDENNRPTLQFVHNLKTYSNEIDAEQLPGRARAMKDCEVYYIEYVNVSYKKTIKQFEAREKTLQSISKTGKIEYV